MTVALKRFYLLINVTSGTILGIYMLAKNQLNNSQLQHVNCTRSVVELILIFNVYTTICSQLYDIMCTRLEVVCCHM
jgi:hypothetical protein